MANREALRTSVRGAYDIQKLRIAIGNRIVANWKVRMGQEPGKPEDELDAEGKRILADLRAEYAKITDAVGEFPKPKTFAGMEHDGIISDYTELSLVAEFIALEVSESNHFKRLGHILEDYPIWTEFMKNVKGIGPAMAACIISELDPHKAKYPSSFWRYCGLDVADDGRGRSKRAEHLVDVEYVNAEGEVQTRKGITYNPFIKTKLMGVLASSFLRAGENKYERIYRAYKLRIENHPSHAEKTKGQRNRMALRYMIKMFLIDLHMKWRELEGLPVSVPYHEAKLGIKHGEVI